jgi:hypothetical protein
MSGYDTSKGYNFRFTKKQEGVVEKAAEIGIGTQEPQNPPIKIGPVERIGTLKKGRGKDEDGGVFVLGSNR